MYCHMDIVVEDGRRTPRGGVKCMALRAQAVGINTLGRGRGGGGDGCILGYLSEYPSTLSLHHWFFSVFLLF